MAEDAGAGGDAVCVTTWPGPPAAELAAAGWSGPILRLQMNGETVRAPESEAVLPLPLRLGALRDAVARLALLPPPLRLGPFLYRPGSRCLIATSGGDGRATVTQLTDKEDAILCYLIEHQGEAVPRQVLLDAVWGYADGVTTATVETHLYRLRQKLGEDSGLVVTDQDGYRLVKMP